MACEDQRKTLPLLATSAYPYKESLFRLKIDRAIATRMSARYRRREHGL